jgi:sensor domain CHASE-containing protein
VSLQTDILPPRPPGTNGLALLGTLIAATALLITLAAWFFISRPARQLDLDAATREAVVCQSIVADQLAHVHATAVDYATWDELENHLLAPSAEFAASNLTAEFLQNLRLDGVLLLDRNDLLLNRQLDDRRRALYCGDDRLLADTQPLRRRAAETSQPQTALLKCQNRVLLASVAPVLGTDAAPPSAGQIIFFRFLTDADFQQRAQLGGIAATLLPPGVAPVTARGQPNHDDGHVTITQSLAGPDGREVAQLRITREAVHSNTANRMILHIALSAALVALAMITCGHTLLARRNNLGK